MGSPWWSAEQLASPRALKEHLLKLTLAHALEHSPYYRQTLVPGAPLEAQPFLTKDVAIEQQEQLLAARDAAFSGVISSGSTHGDRRPLRVPRTEAEIAAVRAYDAERAGPATRHDGTEDSGLMLEVRSMQHGLPEFLAPPGVLRVPWTFTANGLKLIEELVTRPQPDGRRVTAMIIGASPLMVLTAHLLDRGVDLEELQVREIGTTGFRLSRAWRRVVETAWGARLYDNFSLSELATPALECEACGFNHWLSPPLICEVVDAFTRAPLQSGTGVLVLTGLYPFQQAMPLIRYWTADLVQLGPQCERADARGIRFRGRLTQTVIRDGMPGEPVVVSPADIVEYLEGRPEVARLPHPCQTLGLTRSPDTGVVKYELVHPKDGSSSPRVRVELRFDPKIFPEAAGAVATGLGEHLLAQSPRLRALEESGDGELELEVVQPGSLDAKWSKY